MIAEPDLDDVAEEFAARLRAGEHPSIESFVKDHPAWGDELRVVLSGVAMMEKFKPRTGDVTGSRLPRFTKPPEKLGEFRIVKELGRGGMGVVYEAVQETLDRNVALKLLPGHWASNDKLRARFRREALAAARLHHSNIVPVFSVGEIDGFCFYAMQLIRGTSLDRLVDGTGETARNRHTPAGDAPPTFDDSNEMPALTALASEKPAEYSRRMVRVALDVANALSYAHSRGVLHRDIKPSNLILDLTGTVWVTDFGVARVAEDVTLTQSGDVVGTLRYMPPERLNGISDERGDVYSLGITLYELLAKREAYPVKTAQQLMKMIEESDPRPLGTVNRSVGKDLETVVMKAVSRNPAHRYATAEAFGKDLQRVLDDRPVHARRAGPLRKTARWCRRNPALAASIALVAASLVGITAVSLDASIRMKAANQNTEQALVNETEQREQAEAVASLSLEALNRTFTQFAPTRLVVAPTDDVNLPPEPSALSPEAVPLLEQLLQSYRQIATVSAKYPKLHSQAAEANHRIGDIEQRLGRPEQAVIAYTTARELYSGLPEGEVADGPVKLARLSNELGRTLRALNRFDDSIAQHRAAIAAIESADASEAGRAECRYELAAAYFCLGRRDMFASAPPQEHPHEDRGPLKGYDGPGGPYGKGGRGFGPPPDDRGPPPGFGGERGPGSKGERGPGGDRKGPRGERPDFDSPDTRKAIAILEELIAESPGIGEYRHLLARCYRELRGGGPGGEKNLLKAMQLLRDLVKEFPRVPDYQFDLCETLGQVGRPMGREFHGEDAQFRDWLNEALSRSDDLMKQYPRVPEYAAAHARYHDTLGWRCYQAGARDDAEANFREAVRVQRKVVEQYPAVVSYGLWLGFMERALGKLLGERGQTDEALTLLGTSTSRVATVYGKIPGLAGLKPFLGMAYEDYANVLVKAGRTAEADAMRKKAEAFGPKRK